MRVREAGAPAQVRVREPDDGAGARSARTPSTAPASPEPSGQTRRAARTRGGGGFNRRPDDHASSCPPLPLPVALGQRDVRPWSSVPSEKRRQCHGVIERQLDALPRWNTQPGRLGEESVVRLLHSENSLG